MAFKLVSKKTGEEIAIHSTVETFRGEKVVVMGFRAPHKASSTGRVYLHKGGCEGEYFPGVIDAEIVEE